MKCAVAMNEVVPRLTRVIRKCRRQSGIATSASISSPSIAYLRYVMNLPENKILTLLNDTYDTYVSLGTVEDYQKKENRYKNSNFYILQKKIRMEY